ncbi:hypothetical protein JTB14_019344 [Gonioctena quinquepunctata]|nr:hypothetical protein JTB14_019344 [Gonioctena quinquepunctata]
MICTHHSLKKDEVTIHHPPGFNFSECGVGKTLEQKKLDCNSQPCDKGCNSQPCDRGCNNQSPCNQESEEISEKVPVLIPFPPVPNPSQPPAQNIINNTNIPDYTANIDISNRIDNVNNISVPISLNSTNQNNVVIHFQKLPNVAPGEINQTIVAPSRVDCCLVVTPGECDGNGQNCREERHWECSEKCNGERVEIEETSEVPLQLTATTIKNESASNQVQVGLPLCRLANGTTVPCPTQTLEPTYQVIYRPVQQPIYYRPYIQQPIQAPVFNQQWLQRPVVRIPQPVILPQPTGQSVQQIPQYVVVPASTSQVVPRINQRQYIQNYQETVRATFPIVNQPYYWGAYQRPVQNNQNMNYITPCQYAQQSQVPNSTPCGSSVQY